VVKQNGGGDSTPSPRTGGDSNGSRDLQECGGASLQNWDDSEGERKRERLWCCAPVVWCSVASRGPIYRDGRERELGFPKGGLAGRNPGAAALAMTLGHGGGSWVTRLLRWQAGVAR
jgi:hypothetical protein